MRPQLSTLNSQLSTLIAIACLLLAAPCFLSPAKAQPAIIVNIPTDLTDPFGFDDSEPSIAVNPINPLEIAAVGFCDQYGGGTNGPVWKSYDGGLTWAKEFIITTPPTGDFGPYDQKIEYNNLEKLFYTGLSDFATYLWHQVGGPGSNLISGQGYGSDQPHLSVDKTGGAFEGRPYSPWLDFNQARPRSTVSWSNDLGMTMNDVPVGDISSFPNRTTRIAVGPSGSVYVIYKTREGPIGIEPNATQPSHFWVTRSDDGGLTWAANGGTAGVSVTGMTQAVTWFTNQWGNPAKGPIARARSSDAWIAVDPTTEAVYAVYCHKDASNFGQVYVARSDDRGVTWNNFRVTDGAHHSAYPEIAVTTGSVVGVLYIDFDDSGPFTNFRHRFAISGDGGQTWSDEILHEMDAGLANNAFNGFLWGDYEGVTAVGANFYGVFTGNTITRTPIQFDPIFFYKAGIPPDITLSLNPTTVIAGDTSIGTVRLNDPAGPSGEVIDLTSDIPDATVPPSVTVDPGLDTATFIVNTNPGVQNPTMATITATMVSTGKSASARLTIVPFIASVEFQDPATGFWLPTLAQTGGALVFARVNLSNPAEEGGQVVYLNTDNSQAATVTPSITIQAGRTTEYFFIFTYPIANSVDVTVSASARGSIRTAILRVLAPVPTTMVISPNIVPGGSTTTGTVNTSGPAPPQGLVVGLSSNRGEATVPPTVTIQPGKNYGSFQITTTAPPNGNVTATITGTYEGVGASANLTITQVTINNLAFNPATVVGGAQSTGTVTLARPAPTNGAVVGLSKSDPNNAIATLPTSVTVPRGRTSATFTVVTRAVPADTSADVTASYNGGTRTATLFVKAATVSSVTFNPTVIKKNTTSQGRVFLTGPAPTGGMVIQLMVLSTNPQGQPGGTVPAQITIPAGATNGSFTYTAGNVTVRTDVTVKATDPSGTFKTGVIRVNP